MGLRAGDLRVVRPAIVVVDRSGSMEDIIDKVELRVSWLLEQLTRDGAMRETLVLAVIDFDYDVRLRRKLGFFVTDETGYQFETRGGLTDFGKALRTCQEILDGELPKIASYTYRPVVFFISDGGNNQGDFTQARAALLGRPLAPKILTFEFKTSDGRPLVLRDLATDPRLYVSLEKTEDSVEQIIRTIYQTLGDSPAGNGSSERRGGDSAVDDVVRAFSEGEIEFNGDAKVYEL